jgi:hypothetical protein
VKGFSSSLCMGWGKGIENNINPLVELLIDQRK